MLLLMTFMSIWTFKSIQEHQADLAKIMSITLNELTFCDYTGDEVPLVPDSLRKQECVIVNISSDCDICYETLVKF